MTLDEWRTEAIEKFGKPRDIAVVCPACGHVATLGDYIDAGDTEASTFAFSCIGRLQGKTREAFGNGPGPCNYAGGGLLRLNPVPVEMPNGAIRQTFAFAESTDD